MALYVIGDLHLSLSSDKPMDVFGDRWADHVRRLRESFSALKAEDAVVLCGDLSWGMSLKEAAADFHFIDELPGRKIILKGNHDYWWTTAAKMERFFAAEGIRSIEILHNNCVLWGDLALCGTRGWFFEEEKGGVHDKKIMNREIMRLEASLKAAGDREKLCFLHYPPRYGADYVCREITSLLGAWSVKECYYGHLHGPGQKGAVQGWVEGVHYQLVSADYLGFAPRRIRDGEAPAAVL
ncbi:MAG: metallophosphoesterase [Oscillospiraceae bacterium]|nr:metallophosphoesterase [Oscillospiraceae bacterium]MBR4691318.1 metallophosphoesterase [Oscillospiraceae bacterium]